MKELMNRLHEERNGIAPVLDTWPIQLGMQGDPWRVMVACILLDRTMGAQVRPVLAEVLRKWPTALDLQLAPLSTVRDVVADLGLCERRARNLIDMSSDFLWASWNDVVDLPGIGRYASDAVRIFCLGDVSMEPTDRVLSGFVRALK